MSENPAPQAGELQAALEDVRRIRELLDDIGEQNPMRVIMRPIFQLGLAFAPLVLVIGLLSQWVMDAPGEEVLGLSKGWAYGLLFGGFAVFGGILKTVIFMREGKRQGIDLSGVWRNVMTTGYFRIIIPIFLGAGFICAFLVQHGHGEHTIGIFLIAYGIILMEMPFALPVPQVTGLSYAMIVAGGLSLFVWPAYPFYKFALLFGGTCLWLGVAGTRVRSDSG